MKPVQRDVIEAFARERYKKAQQKIQKEAPPTLGTTEAAT
jgi:hypothetical protein